MPRPLCGTGRSRDVLTWEQGVEAADGVTGRHRLEDADAAASKGETDAGKVQQPDSKSLLADESNRRFATGFQPLPPVLVGHLYQALASRMRTANRFDATADLRSTASLRPAPAR